MQHIIAVLVEDKPGVLNRVSSLLRRRMLNVDSISASRTTRPGVTRITIALDADEVRAGRVVATLYKLIEVLEVQDIDRSSAVERDLALVTVETPNGFRGTVERIVEEAGARVVNQGERTVMVEVVGEPQHVDAVVERLLPLGIVEIARAGLVALARGD